VSEYITLVRLTRFALTCWLLFAAFLETGPFTLICLALITMGMEVRVYIDWLEHRYD